jgi:hypothetical protein
MEAARRHHAIRGHPARACLPASVAWGRGRWGLPAVPAVGLATSAPRIKMENPAARAACTVVGTAIRASTTPAQARPADADTWVGAARRARRSVNAAGRPLHRDIFFLCVGSFSSVVRVTPALQLSSKVGPPSYSAGIAGSAAAFVNIQRAEVDSIRMVPRRVPTNKIPDAICINSIARSSL